MVGQRRTWHHLWPRPRLMAGVSGSLVLTAAAGAVVTLAAQTDVDAAGTSRANPVPFKTEAQAGPWSLAVTDLVTGDAATQQVTAASKFNDPPASGYIYLLVKIRAKNTSNRAYDIAGDDFYATGNSGLVHRFVGAWPPDPALDGTVKPGESREGWIVLGAAADDKNLLLGFDSLTLPGDWARVMFALEENAKIPDLSQAAAKPDTAGKDLAHAVPLKTPITTADWQVQITQVLSGMDVYNLYPESDYRTTALGSDQASAWLGLKIKATNVRTGGSVAYFPARAFTLADDQGNPIPDVEWLTPPDPDVSDWYYPGASREGWVVFELPASFNGNVVRFQPFRTDADVRYLSFGSGQPAGGESAQEANNTPPAGPTIASGTTVTVTEETVNLRDSPSTSGKIVEEVKEGTTLQVTGDPQTADGYTWYPVTDAANNVSGWIAGNFIRAEQ